jgi:MYXO-CTERM domain-containing protein
MSLRSYLVAAIAPLALLAVPRAAHADQTSLSAECTYSGGVDCNAACDVAGYGFKCGIDADVECKAKLPTECQANVDVSCNVSCEADCSAKCKVDPPKFSCAAECEARVTAECSAQVDAECNGECSAAADQAKCKGDCHAKLSGRCQGGVAGSCEAECKGQPGSVDCTGQCKASCKGSCDASVKVKCNGYLKCQADVNASCESDLKVQCTGGCTTNGGVLVCNQNFITQGTIDDVEAYLQGHGYANGSASASCSGNTCEAAAEGEAGFHCSTSSASTSPLTGCVAALGGLAILGMVRRRRS